jgi:antitoxin PrlF
MYSTITSKFQVTIPRKVRESLRLRASDAIEWTLGRGRVTIAPAAKPFLEFRNKIRVGRGSIKQDIAKARSHIAVS